MKKQTVKSKQIVHRSEKPTPQKATTTAKEQPIAPGTSLKVEQPETERMQRSAVSKTEERSQVNKGKTEPKKLDQAGILKHLKEYGTIHTQTDNADTAEIQKLIEAGKIGNVSRSDGYSFRMIE